MSPETAALLISLWSLHSLLAAAATTLFTLKFAPQSHFASWVVAAWFLPYAGAIVLLTKLLIQPSVSQAEADAACPESRPTYPPHAA